MAVKAIFPLTTFVSYDTNVPMDTKTINLRGLPEELVRRAKACAALHGVTLKSFIMEAVERAVERDIPAMSAAAALLRPSRGMSKQRPRRQR